MKQPQRAADLQNVPRPVAAMARTYEQSVDFGWHSHRRGQLLQIIDGFMTARTPDTSFIIPCGYGLLITPEIPHAVHSHGRVSMQSVYIEPDPGIAMDVFSIVSSPRPFTSIRCVGVSISSFIKSRRLVPPAMNFACEFEKADLVAASIDEAFS